jgi:hypothetical protein
MPRHDDDKTRPGISNATLRALAEGTHHAPLNPNEANAMNVLLDMSDALAKANGTNMAGMAFLAAREFVAGLLAWNGVQSLDLLLSALKVEARRRAAELHALDAEAEAGEGDAQSALHSESLREMPCSPMKH